MASLLHGPPCNSGGFKSVGQPFSFKKQQLRLEKERRRAEARRRRREGFRAGAGGRGGGERPTAEWLVGATAVAVDEVWKLVRAATGLNLVGDGGTSGGSGGSGGGAGAQEAGLADVAALTRFYPKAYLATVTAATVDRDVARAFFVDKFSSRADETCCALICLWERVREAAADEQQREGSSRVGGEGGEDTPGGEERPEEGEAGSAAGKETGKETGKAAGKAAGMEAGTEGKERDGAKKAVARRSARVAEAWPWLQRLQRLSASTSMVLPGMSAEGTVDEASGAREGTVPLSATSPPPPPQQNASRPVHRSVRSVRSVRVASVGGGPGNDMAGFLIFNHLLLRAGRVDATVYDFSPSWQPLVEAGIAAVGNDASALASILDAAVSDQATDGGAAGRGGMDGVDGVDGWDGEQVGMAGDAGDEGDAGAAEGPGAARAARAEHCGRAGAEDDRAGAAGAAAGAAAGTAERVGEGGTTGGGGGGGGGRVGSPPRPHPRPPSPSVRIDFGLADLQAPVGADVNTRLLRDAVPDTDVFLFSYVAHESSACEHPLLAETLRRAKVGAVFIFLDPYRRDAEIVTATVEAVEAEGGRDESGREEGVVAGVVAGAAGGAASSEGQRAVGDVFARIPLGSHKHYAFVGVGFVKLRARKQRHGGGQAKRLCTR